MVTKSMIGKPNEMMSFVMVMSPKNLDIDMTAYVLKILEPNTFPTAIAFFPFLTAAKLTITSGNEVPSATQLKAITSLLIPKPSDISPIDCITYSAPNQINAPPINKVIYSLIPTFGLSSSVS